MRLGPSSDAMTADRRRWRGRWDGRRRALKLPTSGFQLHEALTWVGVGVGEELIQAYFCRREPQSSALISESLEVMPSPAASS